MKIRSFTGGMAQTNAYLLGENDNCILIDAPLGVASWLQSEGASPSDVLLTHQHYDHVEGVAELASQGVLVHAHSEYSKDLTLEKLLQESGIDLTVTPYTVDHIIAHEGELDVAGQTFAVAHIPGHAPDSLVFSTQNLAFVGDTLFASGVGRADLPGGDMDLLIRGIQEKLMTQDPATQLLPGHGPVTTVEIEKSQNPYL
jgi:glyoxylase-like metal-dependent hydrolase (beta-lactamase superfamily II)